MLNNFYFNKEKDPRLEKNLKLMMLSAIVLFALLIYALYKSSESIQSSSYYLGLVLLLILLSLSFVLRFYKKKVGKIVSQTNFAKQLQGTKESEQNNLGNQDLTFEHLEFKQSNITFKDVAGIEAIKEELEEIVDFLNNPKKYLKHGIKLPKGVLLVGPPGVGKTLIARAVAGEAKVPFLYQSGASFVHIYVGMGAKRVKELFAKAKANAPAIIFIDEIDAVGKRRTSNANEEREATLNELLTQMDGFDGDSGVIVIAATNKIEVLDEALLRAGRFDRRLFLKLPDIQSREKILNLYLKNKKFEFDIKEVAFNTAGFTSAALATLVNEALLNMVKRGKNVLETQDIEVAKQKVEFGKKEKSLLSPHEREILAIYQVCKAYIAKKEIALFGEFAGASNTNFPSKTQLFNQLKIYLAGSVGVEVEKGEAYLVNPSDLKNAYELAEKIVEEYKMESNIETLIQNVRSDLKSELYKNIEEIERLKGIILENEIVKNNEFKH